MKRFLLAAVMTAFAGVAFSAPMPCDKRADEKKLSGDDRATYLKQCEKDLAAATASCQSEAAKQALDGGKKTSFVTECVTDAMAAKK